WFSSHPKAGEQVMEEASDFPEDLTWNHFERARQEALLALVDQDASEIEQLVGELSGILAKFDQFSRKTYRETHPKKVYRHVSDRLDQLAGPGRSVGVSADQGDDVAARRRPLGAGVRPPLVRSTRCVSRCGCVSPHGGV